MLITVSEFLYRYAADIKTSHMFPSILEQIEFKVQLFIQTFGFK